MDKLQEVTRRLITSNYRLYDFYITGPVQQADVEQLVFDVVQECVSEIHCVKFGVAGNSYYTDKVAEHIEKCFGGGFV